MERPAEAAAQEADERLPGLHLCAEAADIAVQRACRRGHRGRAGRGRGGDGRDPGRGDRPQRLVEPGLVGRVGAVPHSIFALEACLRLGPQSMLPAELRALVLQQPAASTYQDKWSLYRRACDILLENLGAI